jgi:glycerophosphoryl diester phosphodiesterase
MARRAGRLLPGILFLGAAAYILLKRRSRPIKDHPFLAGDKPLVMAHRGGEGLWPPNTLYAFQKAVEMGVDILELDIHTSADGALVVRHDDTVDRTTNGSGAIRDLTLAQIKALDAGYPWSADGGQTYPYRGQGITIPTLEELLEAFPGVRLNIDIKPQAPEVVPLFAQTLERYRRVDDVLVGSFHDDQLYRFRRLCPRIATAAGVRETVLLFGLSWLRLGAVYQPRANAFQVPEYNGRLHVVTPGFVRAAHAHNMEVHVWTVNERADMKRLLDWGVDGLFSDYPDQMMDLVGRGKPAVS